jgi:molecular chaperone DnaJ
VPAGVDTGAQIRLTGEGEAGAMGGEPGNLYISLQVRPHPVFQRDGADLLYVLPVNMARAALGADATVPLVDGEATVKVPAGVQTGHRITLRGKGVPLLNRSGRGDQIVLVDVVTPTDLNDKQRELLEQLASTLPDYDKPERAKNGAKKPKRSRKENGDAPAADEDDEDKGILDRIRDAFVS